MEKSFEQTSVEQKRVEDKRVEAKRWNSTKLGAIDVLSMRRLSHNHHRHAVNHWISMLGIRGLQPPADVAVLLLDEAQGLARDWADEHVED